MESKRLRLIVTASAAVALAVLLIAAATPSRAQTAERSRDRDALSAYAQADSRRARTRIYVSPRCLYRTQALPFPAPYECEAPGPGYVRQCSSRLVQEFRPSGTVIVPRMNCWWERG
jgi:hypothetical protein